MCNVTCMYLVISQYHTPAVVSAAYKIESLYFVCIFVHVGLKAHTLFVGQVFYFNKSHSNEHCLHITLFGQMLYFPISHSSEFVCVSYRLIPMTHSHETAETDHFNYMFDELGQRHRK